MVLQIHKKGTQERCWSFRHALCAASRDASTWPGHTQDQESVLAFPPYHHTMSSWGRDVCKRMELQKAELAAGPTERHWSTPQVRDEEVAACYSGLLDALTTHTSRDVCLGADVQVLFWQWVT